MQLICQSNLAKLYILNTKQKGNLTELQCITAFISQGCSISIPYGDCQPYDFIADINGKLFKIQAKTSSSKSENAIKFSCRSTHLNSKGCTNVRYNKQDVDYFTTFWNNKCYLIPFNECSVEKTLHFDLPKNGQLKGFTFAKDYILEKQLAKIKEEVVKN